MTHREIFIRHLAQTSPAPLGIEISKAIGTKLYDINGKEYLDLIGGISVANIGHRHPAVLEAVHKQLDAYMHVMVYGEFIESPQVRYAQLLTQHLPEHLDMVYFTNSGAEAVEGAMKLAKRLTNRTGIVAFDRSYHGSTQGALSLMGDEYWRNAFRPLLPGISHEVYNSMEALNAITEQTACVIMEPVQAEAGIIVPDASWLEEIRAKCNKTGCLLIFDEIQTGFGRTGSMFAFQRFDIIPDILLLGKALGGGMPLGAFISSRKNMLSLTSDPVLGHITTFGGHPVSCAAGRASMEVLLTEKLMGEVEEKGRYFQSLLHHPEIKSIRRIGLWMAVELQDFKTNKKIIDNCIANGLLTDWFLFADNCLRISPPLTIEKSDIENASSIILAALDKKNNI